MARSRPPRYRIEVEVPRNGRVGQADVRVLTAEGPLHLTDRADLSAQSEMRRVAKELAKRLRASEAKLFKELEAAWVQAVGQARAQAAQEPAEAGGEPSAVEALLALAGAAHYFHAPDSALSPAAGTLAARAIYDGPLCPLHVRVGPRDAGDAGDADAHRLGGLYLDLGDEERRAVEVTAGGWRVVEQPPVRFRRPRGQLPLPVQLRGDTAAGLARLRGLVHVGDADWPLVVAWLASALCPRGSYPVLCLAGEQGSAKSTTARLLRSLVDLTGIEDLAERPDLLDRCVLVGLDTMADPERVTERAYWARADEARPAVLGALLDGVAGGLARLEEVEAGHHRPGRRRP
jgi:hypothetical protein